MQYLRIVRPLPGCGHLPIYVVERRLSGDLTPLLGAFFFACALAGKSWLPRITRNVRRLLCCHCGDMAKIRPLIVGGLVAEFLELRQRQVACRPVADQPPTSGVTCFDM